MFENEKDLFGDFGSLDLGSDLGADFAEFTPIDDNTDMSSIFGEEKKEAETQPEPIQEAPAENAEQKTEEFTEPAKKDEVTEVKENEGTKTTNQQSVEVKAEVKQKPDSEADLFEQVVAQAETKQAESVKNGLTDKLPIFSYANAKEEIVDTSKTFDKLREEKAEDFPELDDSSTVSWKMIYGTITKTVSNPKKTTIESLKKEIENSKTFLDSLKKAKGEIQCKVTPTVTAKKKGIAEYKGICDTVEKAVSSGKVIAFVPSEDGKVYEVRNNRIGTFIAETNNISMLKKVKPGFIPALPKIPYRHLAEIIAFFKSYLRGRCGYEAMACIYWSVKHSEYYVYVPSQKVTPSTIDTSVPEWDDEDLILVMEIHSHHVMPCSFSKTDNEDEKATRLYTVINRLDNVFPNIQTRISVGGKFVDINPAEVFEGIDGEFPEKWRNAVEIIMPLKGDVIK